MNGFLSLSSSSRSEVQSGLRRILFPSGRWDSGPVFEWYNEATTLKTIKRLEIRKDTSNGVPHRFIIAYMSNEQQDKESIYRFDRRPELKGVAVIKSSFGGDNAVATKDEYIPGVETASFERTECEVELSFDSHVDLSDLIIACYGISQDTATTNYSLLRYNCFFFSWTILLFVAKRHLPSKVPQADEIFARFRVNEPSLTDSLVDKAIDLGLNTVFDVSMAFCGWDGVSCSNLINRAKIKLIKPALKGLFQVFIGAGIEKQLKDQIGAQLREKAEVICNNLLAYHYKVKRLDDHLWLSEARVEIRETFKQEILKVLWDGILQGITVDIADKAALSEQSDGRQKVEFYPVVPHETSQHIAVGKVALHAALRAASNEGRSIKFTGDMTHEKMINLASTAARKAALDAAQDAVARTRWQFDDKEKHDKNWKGVWDEWEKCWERTRQEALPKAVETINQVIEEIMHTGEKSFDETMACGKIPRLQTRVFIHGEKLAGRQLSELVMTDVDLEEHMKRLITEDTYGKGNRVIILKAMDDIWRRINRPSHDNL